MHLDKRLLAFLRQDRPLLLRSVLLQALAGLLVVGQAWASSRIIVESWKGNASLSALALELCLLPLLTLLRVAIKAAGQRAAISLAERVKRRLRERLFATLLRRQTDTQEGSGSLVTTLSEGVEALDAWLRLYLPSLALGAAIPFGIALFAAASDLLSGVVLLVTAPLIPFFMVFIGKLAERKARRQWRLLARLGAFFHEAVRGLASLRALGRAQRHAAVIKRVSERYKRATMEVLRVAFLSAFALELLATLSVAVIAVELGLRLMYGRLDFFAALFVLLLAPEFYAPLRAIGANYHAGLKGANAAAELFAIMGDEGEPIETRSAKDRSQGMLEGFTRLDFDQVGFNYDAGKRRILDGISLSLGAGERIALVGSSGAGKTTLCRLLLGLEKPKQGRLLLDERPLEGALLARWQQSIAWVPQRPVLFAGTVAENLRLGAPDASDEALWRVLELVELDEMLRAQSGLATQVGEGARLLSGGERQRLALARALLTKRPFVLLDELSSKLDPASEARLLDRLSGALNGRTLFMVTHRLSTLRLVDRVLVLRAGALEADGPHAHLVETVPLYRRFCEAFQGGTRNERGTRNEEWPQSTELAASDEEPESLPKPETRNLVTKSSSSNHPCQAKTPLFCASASLRLCVRPSSRSSTESLRPALSDPCLPRAHARSSPSLLGGATPVSSRESGASPGPWLKPESLPKPESLLKPETRNPKPTVLRHLAALLWRTPGLRQGLVLSALFGVLTVLSGISLLGTSAWLLATAAAQPHIGVLQVAVVGVRAFGVSRGVFRYAERLSAHGLTLALIAKLRAWLYNRLWPHAPVGLGHQRSGELVRRLLSDVESVEYFLLGVLLPTLTALLVLLLLPSFLAVLYGAGSAVALLAGQLAVLGLAWAVFLSQRDRLGRIAALEGELAGLASEGLEGREELEQYGARERFEARYVALLDRLQRTRLARGRRDLLLEALSSAVPYLSLSMAMFWGVSAVQAGQLSGVELAVVALLTLSSFEAALGLPGAALHLSEALAATARLEALLYGPAATASGDAAWERESSLSPTIELREVKAAYPGAEGLALRGLSLRIGAGERVALVGASGSGKTTVLRVLQSYLPVHEGDVRVDGQAVSSVAEDALRERLGVLEQESQLFTGTVAQNLRLAKPKASDEELREVLRLAGLGSLLQLLPEGLQTWLGEEGARLSGGERRRLVLARLLLRETPALLLDEPTANLDAVTAEELMQSVEQVSRGRTTVVVTHRLVGLERYERVVMMEGGRVLEDGPHADLLKRSARYRDALAASALT
ncbi:MAG: thiol reductant ABC exporter subunit CydD [Myxococcota bacterium]|jgi:ATP-binding cassette subfamily C protein CydCD|nr:thiol reductant ABC exporter subunit CydD [Myxococcota bacterium]